MFIRCNLSLVGKNLWNISQGDLKGWRCKHVCRKFSQTCRQFKSIFTYFSPRSCAFTLSLPNTPWIMFPSTSPSIYQCEYNVWYATLCLGDALRRRNFTKFSLLKLLYWEMFDVSQYDSFKIILPEYPSKYWLGRRLCLSYTDENFLIC